MFTFYEFLLTKSLHLERARILTNTAQLTYNLNIEIYVRN